MLKVREITKPHSQTIKVVVCLFFAIHKNMLIISSLLIITHVTRNFVTKIRFKWLSWLAPFVSNLRRFVHYCDCQGIVCLSNPALSQPLAFFPCNASYSRRLSRSWLRAVDPAQVLATDWNRITSGNSRAMIWHSTLPLTSKLE